MADNYIKFSEEFVLSDNPDTYNAQVSWLNTVLHAADAWYSGKEDESSVIQKLFNAGIDTNGLAVDCWTDFDWKIADRAIWFYSEEHANIYNVGLVVQGLLKNFGSSDEYWCLTWSESCSKLRIGEFGGGAMAVNSNRIITLDTLQLAGKLVKELTSY